MPVVVASRPAVQLPGNPRRPHILPGLGPLAGRKAQLTKRHIRYKLWYQNMLRDLGTRSAAGNSCSCLPDFEPERDNSISLTKNTCDRTGPPEAAARRRAAA